MENILVSIFPVHVGRTILCQFLRRALIKFGFFLASWGSLSPLACEVLPVLSSAFNWVRVDNFCLLFQVEGFLVCSAHCRLLWAETLAVGTAHVRRIGVLHDGI